MSITVLTPSGTPGRLYGSFDKSGGGGGSRPYVQDFTRLGLSGTSARLYGAFTGKNPASATRTYSAPFTRLFPSAVPGRVYGSFTGKSETLEQSWLVSDTIRLYLTDGPVTDVDVECDDVLFPRVTEGVGSVGVARTVSDTLTPRVTDAISLLTKGGVFSKTAADSIVPVVTETINYQRTISLSDTVVAVVTEAKTVSVADDKVVSDSIVPVVTDLMTLQAQAGSRTFEVTDTIIPVLTDTVTLAEAGEVDAIHITARPYGRIRITKA